MSELSHCFCQKVTINEDQSRNSIRRDFRIPFKKNPPVSNLTTTNTKNVILHSNLHLICINIGINSDQKTQQLGLIL